MTCTLDPDPASVNPTLTQSQIEWGEESEISQAGEMGEGDYSSHLLFPLLTAVGLMARLTSATDLLSC